MNTPAHFEGLDRVALPMRPIHVAIGMFDGVHLGHRAVVESAVQSARHSGGVSLVMTFSPHPSVLFRPELPTRLIMDINSKMAKLATLGVDAVVVQPFTPDFAAIAAEDFIPYIKRHLPRLAGIYVGDNFRFGKGRKGDVAMLVAEGKRHGITVFSAPRVNLDGEPISSTRIRERICSGDMKGAAALLGYVYRAEGTVVHGKHLGRTIGFPTLNLGWSPDLRPLYGVYAVRVSGSKSYGWLPAVANYGLRPTVEQSSEPRLEIHLLVSCPYGAGDPVAVEWVRFLRPERKFAGLEELKAQIALDVLEARAEFSLP
ncbi:MAG TPA: riboflavin biosynthesis protein RibF [Opitutaceae bacterium]|nr:riboflavin biosynthesis protein RibF [Opitutaceae bacterium]